MAQGKRMTKAQIVGELSDKTGLTKKEVSAVFDSLRDMIKRELGRRGPGEFVIPDLLKLRVRTTPSRKAGVYKNPFTGEEEHRPAKPAQKKVRATPLKKLKDLVK
jgi:nucleoid DNA-binding protein